MDNLMLKKTLNMSLELKKNVEHIRFAFDKINLSKPTISINKTDIIVMVTNRSLGMPPYIRKHKLKWSFHDMTRL